MNKFKERLTEIIKNYGKTQKEIAIEMNKKPQKINHWKTGYIEPCLDDLIEIANYFNVCIDYLVGRQDWY